MEKYLKSIQESIYRTRMDWVALLVKGYGVQHSHLWKQLGYASEEQLQGELKIAAMELPTVSTVSDKFEQD
ncbi:hypothetical protein VIN01S_29550 [Vibrio inusitatus NBRC 102082]|uniref:Uncharacterized protein n=1 Tax=Vibrio inusitatus NBRC 102082 TaxID=1219070 RepID=A0A4Y3HYS3_9VIBR|nr:hypothetical protein [Vibrio inusitatus]GEA52151.1 hypothetical protein VIN01S_29550 [Vibrio inusitatus NBRC 102082]